MQVGNLVKARHWEANFFGIIVSIRNTRICSVMMNDGRVIDQLIRDLEPLCK